MSTFGDVTYAEASATAPSAEPQQTVDLNDPRLTSETLTIDPEADAFARMPTLPDGKWRAKAKGVDIKDDKGQLTRYAAFIRPKMNDGKPFLATNVEFSVIDLSGEFDGVRLTEYWIKTSIDARKGTSQAATLIRKLGKSAPANASQAAMMDALLQTLAAEPELVIETAWSAECQTCQETAKKKGERAPRAIQQGMHRFPQQKPGKHDPVISCPVCKSQVKAQPRIVGFYALTETTATHGTGSAK